MDEFRIVAVSAGTNAGNASPPRRRSPIRAFAGSHPQVRGSRYRLNAITKQSPGVRDSAHRPLGIDVPSCRTVTASARRVRSPGRCRSPIPELVGW